MNTITVDQTRPRDLTWDERATWGTCPICQAPPGEWCRAEVGIQLGAKSDRSKMQTGEGVHYARIQAAPKSVRLTAI